MPEPTHKKPTTAAEDADQLAAMIHASKEKSELTEAEKLAAKRKYLEALHKVTVTVVDASHIADTEAIDAADAFMTEEKSKAGFFKKLWKHTLAEPYFRQRELNRVRREIQETDNVYTRIEDDRQAHDNAMAAIVQRFALEDERAISKERGEDRHTLDGKAQDTRWIKGQITDLVIRYANGDIDDEGLKDKKNRLFKNLGHEFLKDSMTYADNVLDIAKNAKLAMEHGAKIQELDMDFDIIVGKAKSSIKTEAHYNWIDKKVAWAKTTKIGQFVSPATLSVALGIAYSTLKIGGRMVANNRISHVVTFGGTAVLSGTLAGLNEHQRLADERKQHAREMAKGAHIEGDSPRREEMEKFSYQTETATSLMNTLRKSLYLKDEHGKEIPREFSEAEFNKAMEAIVDIETREALAIEKQIDLISHSHISKVEQENTEMIILLAEAKVMLSRTPHGLIPEGQTIDQYIKEHVQNTKAAFLGGEKGIDQQDKLFRKMQNWKSVKQGLKTVGRGIVFGALMQEGIAAVDGLWGGTHEGVFEGIYHSIATHGETSNHIQTPLENVYAWLSGHPSHLSSNMVDHMLSGTHFKLPEGANIFLNSDGTYNIMHGHDILSDHIKLDIKDGLLTPESINRLGQDGIIASADHATIAGAGTETSTAADYIKHHPGMTTHIHRDGWYDNNTEKFDHNEQRLWQGGVNDTGFDKDGNVVFNMRHMTADGSFHKGLSANAQELMKHGKLFALISFSHDTQFDPIKVQILPNGDMVFPKDADYTKILFENHGGHLINHAKFIEVAENMGPGSDGVDHFRSLATEVGSGMDNITHVGAGEVAINSLQIPLETDSPIFLPFPLHTPLESVTHKKDTHEKHDDHKKADDHGKEPVALAKSAPDAPEVLPKGGFMATPEDYAEHMSYGGLEDDIAMLNRRIRESKGIITLEENDFVSDLGRKRYHELKQISGDDKPLTFNKTELREIGDEMEGILVKSKHPEKIEGKHIKPAMIIIERQIVIAKKVGDKNKVKELQGTLDYLRAKLQILEGKKNQTTMKLFDRVKNDKHLAKPFQKAKDIYMAVWGYKDLLDGSPLKKLIDKDFDVYLARPGNKGKTFDEYLVDYIIEMDAAFEKKLKAINIADNNKKATPQVKARTTPAAPAAPAYIPLTPAYGTSIANEPLHLSEALTKQYHDAYGYNDGDTAAQLREKIANSKLKTAKKTAKKAASKKVTAKKSTTNK